MIFAGQPVVGRFPHGVSLLWNRGRKPPGGVDFGVEFGVEVGGVMT